MRIFAAVATALLLAACTTHKQETPALTGPSGQGRSLVVTVSPDVLNQDGASQSLVQISAFDSNGQPLRNVSMRVEIAVDGAITDFGRLSARNVVTDSNGRASVIYTAPSAVLGVTSDILVAVGVTPSESDFGNATTHYVRIRLVPPGIIGPPTSSLQVDFAAPATNAGDPASFSAVVTDPTGSRAAVVQYSWNFGDGTTATGQTVTHEFDDSGTFLVRLTITDNLGRTATVSKPVTVGAPVGITPTFFTTPAAPVAGQSLTFNASQTVAPAGHRITGYFWDFGDGSSGTGVVTTHTFASAGTYTVLLTVTLDNDAEGTVKQDLKIDVANPTARISVLPPTGRPGDTITFVGNQSTPAPGHRIVSYVWNFGDGTTANGQTVTHAYSSTGTFTVSLIVTDEQGNQGIATASVTISP